MKTSQLLLIICLLSACNTTVENGSSSDSEMAEKRVSPTISNEGKSSSEINFQQILPEWFLKTEMLNGNDFQKEYQLDGRLNPNFLEADFNGDGNIDLAIPIKQVKTEKLGFAIIHGQTNEVFILGAGTEPKNGLSDDLTYIDIWKINREKINEAGVEENTGTGENGELILNNPSLQIEKSDVGGGLFYWNGKEYAYFHQTS